MVEDKRILCVGMCVLDIIHTCEKYPEEDTDKRCVRGHWQRGGNASNNCTVLRQLGCKCEFLGMLSRSSAFKFLRSDCMERGISIENCPSVEQDPPFSSVILSQKSKTRTIIHSNANFPILRFEHFEKINLDNYKWIHFEARNPTETLRMIDMILSFNEENAEATRIKISIELEKMKEENLVLTENADYVFLGKDFAKYMQWNNMKEAVYGLRAKIQNNCTLICTWGAEGSSVLDKNDGYAFVPAFPPEEIVDTLGAGDTFCAATICALTIGKSTKEAVELSSKVTGSKLSFYGYDKISDVFTKLA